MSLLKGTQENEATGHVADFYNHIKELTGGFLPNVFVLQSVSIPMFNQVIEKAGLQANHPKISRAFFGHIRLIVSYREGGNYCVKFNSMFLKAAGISDEQLQMICEDPNCAVLEEKEKNLLLFVLKVMYTPDEVRKEDVDNLHTLGYSDSDIMEACQIAAHQKGNVPIIRAMKIELDEQLT